MRLKSAAVLFALTAVAGWTAASAEEGLDASAASPALASVKGLKTGASADVQTMASGGTTVVPMPSAPKLSAEQMQKLATAAASVYQEQGRPALAQWYCVTDNSLLHVAKNTTGATLEVQTCMQPHGEVEGGNYALSSLPLRMTITADGEQIAEMDGVVGGDGSISRQADWKMSVPPQTFPSADETMTIMIDYWMAYQP
jgi:hypothetical protein